jgi:hypothetical protein
MKTLSNPKPPVEESERYVENSVYFGWGGEGALSGSVWF